ncbi:hypothetical protein B0H21DRAFT_722877 [Amylocystis lapponica]|nr:hypothetical protein B0H21DRAFT_722877 [Amylocystis lapponica]
MAGPYGSPKMPTGQLSAEKSMARGETCIWSFKGPSRTSKNLLSPLAMMRCFPRAQVLDDLFETAWPLVDIFPLASRKFMWPLFRRVPCPLACKMHFSCVLPTTYSPQCGTRSVLTPPPCSPCVPCPLAWSHLLSRVVLFSCGLVLSRPLAWSCTLM